MCDMIFPTEAQRHRGELDVKDGIVRVINSHNLNDSPTRLCASAGG